MKTKIILISAKGQGGKSTTAEYIRYQMKNVYKGEYSAKEYSFATPLKNFLINVMGLLYDQCYGTNDDKQTITHLKWDNLPLPKVQIEQLRSFNSHPEFMTGREVMEIFGTDVCRYMFPDCWANATKNEILKSEGVDLALLCDVRYPNEIEVFKPYNPYIIRLLRNPLNRPTKAETSLDNYDFSQLPNYYEVHNQSMTIEQKNFQIDGILQDILGE